MEEESQILNFEEFRFRNPSPRYDNFYLHFGGGFICELYREEEYYQRFVSEHPDLAKSLCDKIGKLDLPFGVSKSLEPLDESLYEVYRIMKSYGVSDEDLFS